MAPILKVLILDDEEHRHNLLSTLHISAIHQHTYTLDDCLLALATLSPFDIAYLDHDLEDLVKDGTKVAHWISAMAVEKRPRRVVIHSLNKEAAHRMFQILSEASIDTVLDPFEEIKKRQRVDE